MAKKKKWWQEGENEYNVMWFIMSGYCVKVVNWFLSPSSDCYMGTNERAAGLLNWFQGAPGCWLVKCGRTKRQLWAALQPTHNPPLLFLIELITPLSPEPFKPGYVFFFSFTTKKKNNSDGKDHTGNCISFSSPIFSSSFLPYQILHHYFHASCVIHLAHFNGSLIII